MFMKSIFTAAALFLAAGTMPDTAEAKTRVHIGIGVGDPWLYRDCDFGSVFDRCDDGRFGHFYGPRFYHRRPQFYSYRYFGRRHIDRMSCTQARVNLRDHGYRNIDARDCTGRFYSFNAMRKGRLYRVSVNAVTGHISRTRR